MFPSPDPDRVCQAWLEYLCGSSIPVEAANLALRLVCSHLIHFARGTGLPEEELASQIDQAMESLWKEISERDIWEAMLPENFEKMGLAPLQEALVQAIEPFTMTDRRQGLPADAYLDGDADLKPYRDGERQVNLDARFNSVDLRHIFRKVDDYRAMLSAEENDLFLVYMEKIENVWINWKEIGQRFGVSEFRAQEMVREFAERLGRDMGGCCPRRVQEPKLS
jgi:hypothetical protein